jgi:FtsH-binding integral membrane protein
MLASIANDRTATVRRPFYLVMSLILAAIVSFGFSHTVPSDLVAPGLPPLLWVHAGVFATWELLFVAQPSFILRGSITLHRKIGWFGAALAAAMVAMGATAILLALYADTVPPFYTHGLFLMRGFIGLGVFGGLIVAGVARRRQAEWHKRLMLCAAIVIIVPGLERALPIPLMGPGWPFVVDAVVILIALAGPACDWIVRRRIHRAYYWGIGAIFSGQLLADVLAPSAFATAALHALGTA